MDQIQAITTPSKDVYNFQHRALADVTIDLLTIADLLLLLDRAVSIRGTCLILSHNLHSVYLHYKESAFREFYQNASCTYIDGLPIVWLSKAAGLPARNLHRITLLDGFDTVLREAEQRGWRIYYLGSLPDVNTSGIELIRAKYPRLLIRGHHGHFQMLGRTCHDVIERINAFKPDILFVGMGMPAQEMWLAAHLPRLNASVILTCGATLDYITGHAYKPPAWLGPLGLYGLARLVSDPVRLWRRYLIEPIVVLRHMFVPLVRQRLRSNR
jgi:N-acetylglucosaminyldiphosphoundecaprenol N-acetyl-beta-D-mannosaminyltransferase